MGEKEVSYKRIPTTLEETAEFMTSNDYRERFIAEYQQLQIRENKLRKMISEYDSGNLGFIPTCPRDIYDLQPEYMKKYRTILEMRAKVEGIF